MKTHVAFVLDRSGSMASIRDATVEGTVGFIKELKEKGGDVQFSLVAFDGMSVERWVDDSPITDVKPNKVMEQYTPRASTPLFDAFGSTITHLDGKVGKEEKAIVVCMTDGYENASREWNQASLKKLVKKMGKKGNWTFVYLGANQDAFLVAEGMGVSQQNTMAYSSTPGSTRTSLRGTGAAVAMASASMDSATTSLYSDAGVDQDVREEYEKKGKRSA